LSIPIFLKYDTFNNSLPIKTNGDAVIENNYLLLTPDEPSRRGSAYYRNIIPLPNNGFFSTYFIFRIIGSTSRADGFTFVIQPNSNTALGDGGGLLGYGTIPNSFAVEFDTYYNANLGDLNNNHTGIDVNGSVISISATDLYNLGINIANGTEYHVWIDYNGDLQVRISTSNQRSSSILVLNLSDFDLLSFLGGNGGFIGFTGATGDQSEEHRILLWYFDNKYNPIDTSINQYVQVSGRGVIVETLK